MRKKYICPISNNADNFTGSKCPNTCIQITNTKRKKGPWPFSTNKESDDRLFVEFVHTDKLIASMIVNGSIIDTGKLEVKLK